MEQDHWNIVSITSQNENYICCGCQRFVRMREKHVWTAVNSGAAQGNEIQIQIHNIYEDIQQHR